MMGKNRRLIILTAAAAIFLLAGAFVHRQFTGDPVYVDPVFVSVVVWPFFILLFLAALNLSLAFVHMIKRNTKTSVRYLLVCIGAVLACVAAALIDAPTLIYAT